jgi:hypothetical protein
MNDEAKFHLDCDCGSPDHLISFCFTVGDNYDIGTIHTQIQMHPGLAWYQRIWAAIKYVFGAESRFGHWDCTVMDYPKLVALNKWLAEAQAEMEKDPRYKYSLPLEREKEPCYKPNLPT